MRRCLIGTGWKMNNGDAAARAYGNAMRGMLANINLEGIELFVLPPFTSLHAARDAFAGTPIAYGGQNLHWESKGSYTGEISASMLVEAGCRYAEVGHAERFALFGETYERVGMKVRAALEAGLSPIICLGESAAERESADDALRAQLLTTLDGCSRAAFASIVLAYEPRWAIGAADAAPVDWVAQRYTRLRAAIAVTFGAAVAQTMPILYGGAVNAGNARALLQQHDIDGLFVGRAAWTPEGFMEIVRIAVEERRLRLLAEQHRSRKTA